MKLSLSILLLFINVLASSQVPHSSNIDFGSHEYYLEKHLESVKVIGIDSKERIYLIGKNNIEDLNIFYLKRIGKNGKLDLEYGENGLVELKTLFESHHPNGLILPNDKLIISFPYSLGWTDQPKNHIHGYYYQVYKINENGKLDIEFADRGYSCKAPGRFLSATKNKILFTNSDSLIITDNKLEIQHEFHSEENHKLNYLVFNYSIKSISDNNENFYVAAERRNYNNDTDTVQITKINKILKKDKSFGINGEVYQYYQGKNSILNSLDLIDSSLFISTSVYHLAEPVIYKYQLNGMPNQKFGSKGKLRLKKAIEIKDTINLRGGLRGFNKSATDESFYALSTFNIYSNQFSTDFSYDKYFLTNISADGKVLQNNYLGSLQNQPIQNWFQSNGSIYLPETYGSKKTIIHILQLNNNSEDSNVRNHKFDIFLNQTIPKHSYIERNHNEIKTYTIKDLLGIELFKSEKRLDLFEFMETINGIYIISAKTYDNKIINDLLVLK